MLDFFFYVIANLLLILFGYVILSRYSGHDGIPFSEKIFGSFIIGIVMNFLVFFLLGWGQIGFSLVIPAYSIIGIGIVAYFFLKKKIHFPFRLPVIPKYEFSLKHIPLILLGLFIAFRVFFSVFQAVNLPSYFDDEKGNWNLKSKVIYHEQLIGLDPSDKESYVGGGGHQEYPLGFILYKTYITQFLGHWNDSITALIHPIFFYVSIFLIVFGLTKNWPLRIIILYLVTSIPLASWHAGVSYFDLFIATELSLIYYFFLRFTETKKKIYLHLIVWIALLTLNTKNEGAVLIFPSLLPLFYYIVKEKILRTPKEWGLLFLPFLITVPHLIFRAVYHLSFNPHSTSASYGWHGEALPLLKAYFFSGGSYNIFWYIIPILLILSYKKLFQGGLRYIFSSMFLFFTLALAVFLFTNNFQYLLDQTTIHRTLLIFMVPMMIFLISLSEKEISLFFKKHH